MTPHLLTIRVQLISGVVQDARDDGAGDARIGDALLNIIPISWRHLVERCAHGTDRRLRRTRTPNVIS
jgi:hypothetical protein